MVVLEIPLSSTDPHFEQKNEIFGQSFIFEFEWIEKENTWLLHIFDDTNYPLVLGLKLQPQWPLYTYGMGINRILLMLIPTKPGATLSRHSLKTDFLLVARETL
ncbi:MAG: hypothetical protein KC505_09150 [Myxococcales bacterium]|nr:hypothetical protein [Myxococcales bacterium]USN51641.1 MAG: hypothetical protein H6731_04315 [Myxococcales bacterium]